MDPDEHPNYPSLEDRVRRARADQSIAIGYAIGDALEAMWRVLSSLPFSPSAPSRREPGRLRSFLARHPTHR
jgi:hypothetical protein